MTETSYSSCAKLLNKKMTGTTCEAVILMYIQKKYRLSQTVKYQMLQLSRARASTLIISFSTESLHTNLTFCLSLFSRIDHQNNQKTGSRQMISTLFTQKKTIVGMFQSNNFNIGSYW